MSAPRTLPPPGNSDAPKYWRHETAGALGYAVMAYLHGQPLDHFQIGLLRAYLSQWIQSPAWDLNPTMDSELVKALENLRAGVGAIRTVKDIRAWLWAALDLGIDPL